MSSGTHVSYPAPGKAEIEPSNALWGVVSLLLGLLVAILGFFALMMWIDAHNAKDAANRAAASVCGSEGAGGGPGTGAPATAGLQSDAGAAAASADAQAASHNPLTTGL